MSLMIGISKAEALSQSVRNELCASAKYGLQFPISVTQRFVVRIHCCFVSAFHAMTTLVDIPCNEACSRGLFRPKTHLEMDSEALAHVYR